MSAPSIPRASHPGDPHRPGQALGRYELLQQLAKGGMGAVYIGRAKGLAGFERTVAIKCCDPDMVDSPEFVSMFLDEARLAAMIHHPNVVSTFDVGQDNGTLYLVMEYLEGERVSSLITTARAQRSRLPIPVVLRFMVDALTGLHAAHELRDPAGQLLNLVHRDVSPQNIVVGADGVTKILDFGVAKAMSRSTVTRGGMLKGKVGYMSPEQTQHRPLDRRADLWSAGVVLWEALAGRRLFGPADDWEVIEKINRGVIERPSTIRNDVSPALESVVFRALERDPERRYATAAEFAADLERSGSPLATTREVSEYVMSTAGEQILARRALLQTPPDVGWETVGVHSPPPLASSVGRGPAAIQPEPAAEVSRTEVKSGRAPARLALGVVALLVAIAGVVLLVLSLRGGTPAPARPSTPPGVSAPAPVPPGVNAPLNPAPAPAAEPPPAATTPPPPARTDGANPHRAAPARARPRRSNPRGEYNPGAV